MAQHLPIQAKHHCQLKQHTRKQRTTAFPPGSAHTPPGETVPDRLAVFTHRQAPASSQTHCFLVTAWRSSTCRQAHLSAKRSPITSIAWRVSVYRQAPYQNSAFLVYDTPSPQIYHLLTPKVHRRTPILSPRIGEFTTNHM